MDEYPLWDFALASGRAEKLALSDGEWEAERFESEVWARLFRDAKYVKIFDRMIGRHLLQVGHGNGDNQRGPLALGRNYSRSLEWIFQQYLLYTSGRKGRKFEVTCGLYTHRRADPKISAAAAALREFGRELTETHGFELTMNVRRKSYEGELRHARFLFTDQIALLFERGFDLMRDDGLIRDVVVAQYPDGKGWEVEDEARSLSDAS